MLRLLVNYDMLHKNQHVTSKSKSFLIIYLAWSRYYCSINVRIPLQKQLYFPRCFNQRNYGSWFSVCVETVVSIPPVYITHFRLFFWQRHLEIQLNQTQQRNLLQSEKTWNLINISMQHSHIQMVNDIACHGWQGGDIGYS